ncbi:MAG: hypothetical protein HY730_00120 [Candidatus Tectomicrobia bacterium]|uniref:Uncharacterized protein n=1 Tax=Tectimicrobiota bacterium TaxID=2528274 RepID=A0A933LPX9_UNCTE|nr:hypothetical protein [Candidatus Tectomicrobia bacterium]
MSKKEGDTFITGEEGYRKPRGILQALAAIQHYYVAERNGEPISQDFLTILGKFDFFSAGFKTGLIGGLINLLLIPISIGVIDDYIPIFGNRHPGLFDKGFALFLSISFYLGYSLLLATARKYYIGEITRNAFKNLLRGVTAGALFKMVIAFIFFHFMYLFGLEEGFLTKALYKLYPIVKYDTLNAIYQWLLGMRPIFLTSAYFIVCATLIYISIPWISVLLAARKTRRLMDLEDKWR